MTKPSTIRARVAPHAIQTVTRMFNGTLLDIANELFQNARRAQATRVTITTTTNTETTTITIEDDGHGIADPQTLLSLGQSTWADTTMATEDPAGMGFFALAGHATSVDTYSRDRGFRLEIPATAWTGDEDATVFQTARKSGTAITFSHPATDLREIRNVFARAALHFPLPATLDGEQLRSTDFLEGATAIISANGVRIGVYQDVRLDHVPNVNFHGLTLNHKLPSVKEVNSTQWRVRIDILDAPEISLVLPARKEFFHNSALQQLFTDSHAAIYTVIARNPAHQLSFSDWKQARDYIPDIPPAAAKLSPWTANPARESYRTVAAPVNITPDAIIFEEADSFDSTTFGRALSHSTEPGFTPFTHTSDFIGYDWYDAIPHYQTEAYLYADQHGQPIEQTTKTLRPHSITLLLSASDHEPIKLASDFTTSADDCHCDDPDETWLAVLAASDISPGDLADLITDAAFSAYDGSDADSFETQETRFRHDAQVRAFEVLVSTEAALIEDIRLAFHEKIAWRIPAGTSVTLSYGTGPTTVTITPKPEEETP